MNPASTQPESWQDRVSDSFGVEHDLAKTGSFFAVSDALGLELSGTGRLDNAYVL